MGGGRDEGTSKRIERLLVPDALARAAAAHQRCLKQLDLLRRRRLTTASAHQAPTAASSRRGAAALVLIHESRIARDAFRDEIGHLVDYLEGTGASLRRIVEHVRGMIDALQASGVLTDDGGAMADEVSHWIVAEHGEHANANRQTRHRTEARVLPMKRPNA